MLHTRTAVIIQILLNLRFAQSIRRFVDGEFDAATSTRHHFRHEGRILGGDVVVIEMDVLRESHHVFVEIDPVLHVSQFHVADAVIHVMKSDIGCRFRGRTGRKAGHVESVVPAAVHETVQGIAIGIDRGLDQRTVLIRELARLHGRPCATFHAFTIGGLHILHRHGNIFHAIAMDADELGDGRITR